LGEPGWKERYYEENFSAKTSEELDAIRKDVVSSKLKFDWF
jgi:5'-3' exoribonuclease 2